MALHGVVLQALVALWLVASGALVEASGASSPTGLGGLGLLILSWIGLLVAQWRAARAEPVLRRALREGLDREDESAGELGRVRSFVPWAELVVPFHMRRQGIELIEHIAYGDAGHRNHLDIYRPPAAKRLFRYCCRSTVVDGRSVTSGSRQNR